MELVSAWFPLDVAEGTALEGPNPISGGVRQYLAEAKGLDFDHLTETITARHATPSEAELLRVSDSTPVLVLLVTARDPDGQVLQVVDVVLPGNRHELEDAYPLT